MGKIEEKVIEVGMISDDSVLLKHIQSVCREFDYSFASWPNLEVFMEAEPDCMVVITNTSEQICTNQNELDKAAAECCQAAKGICNDAFVVCVVQNIIRKELLPFLKKSGADLILFDHQLIETSILEFLLTQKLRARFIPIKVSELVVDSLIDFHIHALIPHRAKFLPCASPGALTVKKFEKLRKVSEIYINRRELGHYRDYLEARPALSSKDLMSRCRIRFLCLCAGYADLVLLLTDQAEQASYEKGAELLVQCKKLCSELLSVVAEFENVWDVVDNSAIGNMESVERSTAVATYVAVFALRMDVDHIEDIMVGALISDISLLFLHSKVLKKLRMNILLNAEEQAQFILHPVASVNLALERKLQIDPKLRKIIEMTHERYDGCGFPFRPLGARIPIESQLIQFCQELDTRTLVRLGKVKNNPIKIRADLIEESIKDSKRFSPEFCHGLKKAWTGVDEVPITAVQNENRVLIIDDEIDLCELFTDYLVSRGVLAEYITDPTMALGHIAKFNPHTIVLDVNMPKLGGLNLLKLIREIPNYSPHVLLISGHSSISQEEILKCGASELLQKPFEFERLFKSTVGA